MPDKPAVPAPKILIVEDEARLAESLRYALDKAGYDVAVADSVEKAIPLLEKFLPHGIVLDGRLPGESGMSLASWLKSHDKHRSVKVVAISGDPGQKMLMGVMKDLVNAFLEKPFKNEKLVETLARIVPLPGR
jgi:two-component system alkaline phosphatase synthesis response regulator PhoP